MDDDVAEEEVREMIEKLVKREKVGSCISSSFRYERSNP